VKHGLAKRDTALVGLPDRSRIAAPDNNASIAAHVCHNLGSFHRLIPSRHFYYLNICKVTGNETMATNRSFGDVQVWQHLLASTNAENSSASDQAAYQNESGTQQFIRPNKKST
jgi:hypothetical protein